MACVQPFYSQWKGSWVPFPCGRCPPCRKRRTDGWVFRMLQEDKKHLFSHFITLTYDSDHLPISPNGLMTLDKSAFPAFMKRLRRILSVKYGSPSAGGPILKYYYCGEYGTRNHRPHYHAIVFGCPDPDLYAKAWALDGVQFGKVDVGSVSGDSIAYTTAYACSSDHVKWGSNDDRVPEFACMSKGIGDNYITPATVSYHKADLNRNYLVKDGGFRIAMPRYYRQRIFNDDDLADQRSIIETAVSVANGKEYSDFIERYPSANWELFKSSKRDALIRSFEAKRFKRKL